MTWGPSRPHTRADRARTARILARDAHICYVCHRPGANQVDHRIPRHQGGSDDDTNLAAIHARPCHQAKTQAEAAAARHKTSARRPNEKHPGLTH